MSHQDYFYKIRPIKRLLPTKLYDDLKLYFTVPNSKPKTRILPPRVNLNSRIIDSWCVPLISNWIGEAIPLNHQHQFNRSSSYTMNLTYYYVVQEMFK